MGLKLGVIWRRKGGRMYTNDTVVRLVRVLGRILGRGRRLGSGRLAIRRLGMHADLWRVEKGGVDTDMAIRMSIRTRKGTNMVDVVKIAIRNRYWGIRTPSSLA